MAAWHRSSRPAHRAPTADGADAERTPVVHRRILGAMATVRQVQVTFDCAEPDVRVGTGMVGAERLAALDAESARLVGLGATQVRRMTADQVNESCIVMQDVEGNEFCLD